MTGPADEPVDLLIIGGGINGAGIARDAAGRGLSVTLCEQGDIGGATSSASTKLIHGGLRYLEHFEFRLVREALMEREVLLNSAPHIIRPMRFVLPHDRAMRPAWLLRLGLFLYDHLGARRMLPGSQAIDLRTHPAGRPLAPRLTRGFEYSDCWVEDSRLVLLALKDAAELGATILPRTRCLSARRMDDLWHATLTDPRTGGQRQLAARTVVNAAGPWVGQVLTGCFGVNSRRSLRLVKGSHIVVPRLYEGEHAYLLQNEDRRIIFAIPYERRFTLIGTTDVEFQGDPAAVTISEEETAYLCNAVSRWFTRPVRPEDVVWSYSGVRPLHDDASGNASAVTRDYELELDGSGPPLLSVFGGKLTTFRRLSEEAVDRLAGALTARGRRVGDRWTRCGRLPGGDMDGADFDRFLKGMHTFAPWLPDDLRLRYARTYGTRTRILLSGRQSLSELGAHFGGGVYERELEYGMTEEWVATGEDFLWRRTRMGLHLTSDEQAAVKAWVAARSWAVPVNRYGR